MAMRWRFAAAGLTALAVVSPARANPRRALRAQSSASASSSPVTAGEICATIATLADDSLEGRRAGTESANRAARWIAARFEAIGLEPLDEAGFLALRFLLCASPRPHADPHAEAAGASLTSAIVAGSSAAAIPRSPIRRL